MEFLTWDLFQWLVIISCLVLVWNQNVMIRKLRRIEYRQTGVLNDRPSGIPMRDEDWKS